MSDYRFTAFVHLLTSSREGKPVATPNADVTRTENERVAKRGQLVDGLYPSRPGYLNQGGREIVLRTNFLHLETHYEKGKGEVRLYRYNVSTVEQLSRVKKRQLMDAVLALPFFQEDASMKVASDYANIIVTNKNVDLGPAGRISQSVEIRRSAPANELAATADENSQQAQQARQRRTKQVNIVSDGSFTPRELVNYLRATAAGSFYQDRADVIQLLNIIIARQAGRHANIYQVGRNSFYPAQGHPNVEYMDLGAGLQAIRGYFSSVRTSTNRILLNLNVSHGAFYEPINLPVLIDKFLGHGPNNAPMNQRQLQSLHALLKLIRVETNYLKARDASGKIKLENGQPKKIRTVKTIVAVPVNANRHTVSQVEFRPSGSGNPISVLQYFRNQHNINLNPSGLVLNTGTARDPSWLPAELARVIPGQAYRKFLSGNQTSVMIRFAARPPSENAMSIAGTANAPGNGLVTYGLNNQADTVQVFGFSVNTSMLTVHGRILNAPALQYSAGVITPAMGSWNLKQTRFHTPGSFKKWGILVLDLPNRPTLQTHDRFGEPLLPENQLVTKLARSLREYGLVLDANPRVRHVTIQNSFSDDNRNQINEELDKNFSQAEQAQFNLLFIILPGDDKYTYAMIKFYGDVKYGIQTINCVGSKLQKPKGQEMYMGNLAIKFNIKGGGVNHVLTGNSTLAKSKPLDKQTMLMGIDVTHPSPGSVKGAPSIACVVASTDEHLCQWPGSVEVQTGRQEMVEGLSRMIVERLRAWQKTHSEALPTKIVVYRDGVSEGQYRLVLEQELPRFREAFQKVYGDQPKWPKMSIIVVGKRHHARFYPTKKEDASNNGNPLPGTYVDRGITDAWLWDFYLQAHQGLQGTARPAHYVVIMDQIGFQVNQLVQFTHNLCYLFNRATKAVSICPPAYYADLLAERGRQYLHTAMNENHGSDTGSQYNASTADWTGGVHDKLANTTWYI